MANPDEHLAMHAVLTKVSATANAQGVKSYKVAFSYPRAFMDYIHDLLGQQIDVYWNSELVLRSAKVVGMKQRPVKDSDPENICDLDCGDTDTKLANLADAVNDAGDLEIAVPQGTLFSSP